jgi:hypothetical protein
VSNWLTAQSTSHAKNRVRVALSTAHPILIVLNLSMRKGLLKVPNAGLSGRAV